MTFYTTDPRWIIFLWLPPACAELRLAQSNGYEISEQSLKNQNEIRIHFSV